MDLLKRAEPRARSARHQRFFCTAAEVMEVGNASKAGQGMLCSQPATLLRLSRFGETFLGVGNALSPTFSRRPRLERIRLLFTYITATANCAALPYHYHRATASFLSSFLCPAFDNPAWRHGPVVSRYRARFPLGGFFWLFAYPSSHLLLAAGGRQREERSYTHCATFLPNLAPPQLIFRSTYLNLC